MTAETVIASTKLAVPRGLLNRVAPGLGDEMARHYVQGLRARLIPVLRLNSPVRTGRLKSSWRITYEPFGDHEVAVRCVFYGRFRTPALDPTVKAAAAAQVSTTLAHVEYLIRNDARALANLARIEPFGRRARRALGRGRLSSLVVFQRNPRVSEFDILLELLRLVGELLARGAA